MRRSCLLWLSLLPLLLSLLPTCFTEDGQKGERRPAPCLLAACCLLSSSVLFCCACFNSATPSSSPLLSGLFQTPGAGQEPPGLALLCPLLLPIHTGTQSSVSSQQQLQEDKIAAGHPAASQTVTHFCMKSRAVCWLLYCSVSQERCWIFLLFPCEPSLWTCDLQAWPISESPELKPVQMVNTVASPARFHFFFSLCGFCLHAFCFCSPFLSVFSGFWSFFQRVCVRGRPGQCLLPDSDSLVSCRFWSRWASTTWKTTSDRRWWTPSKPVWQNRRRSTPS